MRRPLRTTVGAVDRRARGPDPGPPPRGRRAPRPRPRRAGRPSRCAARTAGPARGRPPCAPATSSRATARRRRTASRCPRSGRAVAPDRGQRLVHVGVQARAHPGGELRRRGFELGPARHGQDAGGARGAGVQQEVEPDQVGSGEDPGRCPTGCVSSSTSSSPRSTTPPRMAAPWPAARTSRATTSTACSPAPRASRPSPCAGGCCSSAPRGSCGRGRSRRRRPPWRPATARRRRSPAPSPVRTASRRGPSPTPGARSSSTRRTASTSTRRRACCSRAGGAAWGPARPRPRRPPGHAPPRARPRAPGGGARARAGGLARELRPGFVVVGFEGPEPTAALMAERLVRTFEVWIAAIAGEELPGDLDPRAAGDLARALRRGGAALRPASRARCASAAPGTTPSSTRSASPRSRSATAASWPTSCTFGAVRREALAALLTRPRRPRARLPGPLEWEDASA